MRWIAVLVCSAVMAGGAGAAQAQGAAASSAPQGVTHLMLPPVPKALLFPTTVQALGKGGHNISTEVWWTPSHPYKSSLTGISAADLAKGYEQASGKQWTQPIGFVHSLFEVAVDALKRAQDPSDGAALAKAIGATKLDTVVGPIAFGSDKVPPFAAKNIAKTPLVGGQWRLDGDKYKIVVTENSLAPQIPVGGKMQLLS